jgi:hypothetical protein
LVLAPNNVISNVPHKYELWIYNLMWNYSFLDCYEAEFEPIQKAEDGTGVHLEHLIASVQGVDVAYGENGNKRVQWSEKREFELGMGTTIISVSILKYPNPNLHFLNLLFCSRNGSTLSSSIGTVGSGIGESPQNIPQVFPPICKTHSCLPSSLWASVSGGGLWTYEPLDSPPDPSFDNPNHGEGD